MTNRIFDLLCRLNAVQDLLRRDGDTLSMMDSDNKNVKSISEEVDKLCTLESEIYNEIRKELLSPKTEKQEKSDYIKKKENQNV